MCGILGVAKEHGAALDLDEFRGALTALRHPVKVTAAVGRTRIDALIVNRMDARLTLPQTLQVLQFQTPSGRIVVIGVGAGAAAEINLLSVMQKRAVVRGSTLRTRSLEDKASAARAVEHHVLPSLADGRITVPVAATFKLAEA